MKSLEPVALWKFFHEITRIPRPSKKEEQMIAYLKAFAEKHKLEIKMDAVGNVLICKVATKGYENKKTTILHTHTDYF